MKKCKQYPTVSLGKDRNGNDMLLVNGYGTTNKEDIEYCLQNPDKALDYLAERFYESTLMVRAIFPKYITKDLITVIQKKGSNDESCKTVDE